MKSPARFESTNSTNLRLRLLQTTDLHMHIMPFDYSTMQHSHYYGLANLVSRISAFEADDVPTLLFDTGDFLQGTPLADYSIQPEADHPHPIAYAFNKLNYDAIALGNHDFDYGIETLRQIVEQIDCPVLSANVALNRGNPPYAATTLISVPASKNDEAASIKVGVLGLTTPALALMDQKGCNVLTVTNPVTTARIAVDELQDQGADIIVALCHFGIDPDDHTENVAADIAEIVGIDAVMAGHTHETFPIGSPRRGQSIDFSAGTIYNTPTVMAGAFGQQLGVIELRLIHEDHTIKVDGHHVELCAPLASG